MRRPDVQPVPYAALDPAPTVGARRGMGLAPLIVLAAVAAGLALAFLPHWAARQRQAFAAGVVLAWVFTWPAWRHLDRRGWASRRGRWAAGVWAGGLVAGWSISIVLTMAWAVTPAILWGASRAGVRRGAQRTEDVKPAAPVQPSLEGAWQSAATHAAMVHRSGPAAGRPLDLTGPATPNGVGGSVLTVALTPGITPETVAASAGALRRWHLAPYLYVRPAGGDLAVLDRAEIHCYTGRPLAAAPIPWQRLGNFYVPGVHAVPYAFDVFGDPLTLDMRKCTLYVGESRIGKTGVQLATLAGCALGAIPVQVHLADNRSGGDRELRALAGAAAGYARSAPEVWHQVHLLETEVRTRREAGVSADGRVYSPTGRWPLVHLMITELIALLTARTSRPPSDAELAEQFEQSWPEYTGNRFERKPGTDDWHMMIAESLGGLAREGASVGVSVSMCTQGAQLDISPAMRHARRHIPQNIALRLRTGSDVDPALGEGALAAGAHAHELPPNVPGLLYVRPDGLTVVHGRGAYVPPAELPELAALLTAALHDPDHASWPADRGGAPT